MGEVMLTVELEDAAARRALAAALAERRWAPIEGIESTFHCHFENGFIDEVRRIVAEDVRASAQQAGPKTKWRAAHVWSAVSHRVLSAGAPVDPAPEGRADVWCDGERPVGPTAEVMVALARGERTAAWRDALTTLSWRPIAGVPSALTHAFDLAMFAPIEPLVRRDLDRAARTAGVAEWRAAWSQSTWEHALIEGPLPARDVRPLPWDPKR